MKIKAAKFITLLILPLKIHAARKIEKHRNLQEKWDNRTDLTRHCRGTRQVTIDGGDLIEPRLFRELHFSRARDHQSYPFPHCERTVSRANATVTMLIVFPIEVIDDNDAD